jgi:hypothetical protein
MRRAVIALLAVLTLAAACSGAPQAPLSARALTLKAPGCHKPFTPAGGVAVQASGEQECLTPDAEVFAATFTSASLERAWIIAQQAGTCETIQGRDWAALVAVTSGDDCTVTPRVARALGGRMVSSS